MGPAEKPHQQLDAPAQGSMPPVAITANGAGGAAHAAAAPVTLEADQQDVAKVRCAWHARRAPFGAVLNREQRLPVRPRCATRLPPH